MKSFSYKIFKLFFQLQFTNDTYTQGRIRKRLPLIREKSIDSQVLFETNCKKYFKKCSLHTD